MRFSGLQCRFVASMFVIKCQRCVTSSAREVCLCEAGTRGREAMIDDRLKFGCREWRLKGLPERLWPFRQQQRLESIKWAAADAPAFTEMLPARHACAFLRW